MFAQRSHGRSCPRAELRNRPSQMFWLLVGSFVQMIAPLNAAERRIEVETQRGRDPILITSVSVHGRTVECGLPVNHEEWQTVRPFEAADDWLAAIRMDILNRTNKAITYIHINLLFPETGTGTKFSPIIAASVRLGKPPDGSMQSEATAALSLAPGETILIPLKDYQKELARTLSPWSRPVSTIAIHRIVVFFDDGMRWLSDRYSVPSLDGPGKFKSLEPTFFPGDENGNWPSVYPPKRRIYPPQKRVEQ